MSNPNFDQLVSTTLKNYRAIMADNITLQLALLAQLKKMGFIREEPGGTTIVEPLMIAENSTVSSYSGYDIIDTTPQTGMSAAEFNWKQVAGSVSISGFQEFVNSGDKVKIINLLEKKIMQLEISMRQRINNMLMLDGTGNGGKDITGLSLLVEDGAAWSSVGGIDSNANTYWRNQFIDLGGSWAASGLDNLRTLINNCSRPSLGESVGLIISTQGVYEAYEKSAVVNLQVTDTNMADLGFKHLVYKGIPWVWDTQVPLALDGTGSTHAVWVLMSQYLNFVIGKGRNFISTPFQKPENQEAKVSQMILYAQLTTNNRARQGLMDGIVLP